MSDHGIPSGYNDRHDVATRDPEILRPKPASLVSVSPELVQEIIRKLTEGGADATIVKAMMAALNAAGGQSEPLPIMTNPELVAKAIIGVMGKVKEVAKSGYNKEGKYGYVYFGDVRALLQDAFVSVGLTLNQRQVGNPRVVGKTLMIKYTFDAFTADGGIILGITTTTGACRFEFKSGTFDDKAPNKAFTAGEKSAMTALFKIAPDDNQSERTLDADPDTQGMYDEEPAERTNFRGPDDRGRDRGRDEPRRGGDRPRDEPRDRGRRDDPPRDDPPRGGYDNRDDPPSDRGRGSPDRGRGGGNADEPPDGRWDDGPREPPPSDVTAGHRDLVTDFQRKQDACSSEEDAAALWRDDAALLTETNDRTYTHLVDTYEKRWGIRPPAI
jgi:hypothetical protein